MKAVTLYINILKGLLDLYHLKSTSLKPDLIGRAKLIARASVIIALYTKDRDKSVTDVCTGAYWLDNIVGGNCLLAELILALTPEEKNRVNMSSCEIDTIDISFAYEQMLSTDTVGLEVVEGKGLRNQLGSYYSPQELVTCLTKQSLEYYIRENGTQSLAKAKIVDFACGAGAFLLCALKLIRRYAPNIKKDLILSNIYACDVDLLALELAKLNIIDFYEDYTIYQTLSKHFFHANFLLHGGQSNPVTPLKTEISTKGFIYHPSLAIGTNFLQEYDIILGNPPWEKIRFEEKKFYAQFSEKFLQTNFKFDLPTLIADNVNYNPEMRSYVEEFCKNLELSKKQIKESEYFSSSTAGELNSSTLFADACFQQRSKNGVVGIIIKSSSILSPVNKNFFKKIRKNIVAVYDFINTNKYFNIDSRERYCLLILGKSNHQNVFKVGMNLKTPEDIPTSCVKISNVDLELMNSETNMLPNIMCSKDLNLLLKLYHKHKTIGQLYPHLKYGRIVHFTSHVKFLDKVPQEDNIPVYEGKFFTSFDGLYAGFNYVDISERYKNKASAKKLLLDDSGKRELPLSRFYIKKDKWAKLSQHYNADFMLAWHSLTSASNERACVATILPFIPASQSVQFLITSDIKELIFLSCVFNSIVFDYEVKNKLTGVDLTQTIIKQVPIPSIKQLQHKREGQLLHKLLSLCYTILAKDNRLDNLWRGLSVNKIPLTEDNEVFITIDSIVAKFYDLTSEELQYIAGKYPKLYTKANIELLLQKFMAIP